jgi:MFS family permease
MTKPVRILSLIVLNAYWVGLSFMWNSLHVMILPALLLLMVPESLKNTYLGLLTFSGLVIAMIVQPVSGAISDQWVSPLGRRRPLIILGTAFDFLFLAVLAWTGGLAWLAIGYFGLQLSSNLAHGPLQGLLPDQVPEDQLGRASGFKNLMDMAGLIVSSLIVGRVLDPQALHPVPAISLIAALLAVSASVTILGVREKPSLRDENKPRQRLGEAFRIDWHVHRRFAWLVASRMFFLLAIYGIQVFALYFLRDVLGAANPVKLTGDLLASITIALVLAALAGGWIGDRFGHTRMSYLASGFGTLGCLLMLFARTPSAVLIFGGILGVAIGLYLTANWALLNELAPAAEAGKFMGLTNLATAGAAALGRLEGPFIDLLNNARPGAWWGYSGLFLMGAVSILVSIVLLSRVGKMDR